MSTLSQVAIFDLDGTLLNSIADIALCANMALEKAGLPGHEVEEYKDFVGWGPDVLIQKVMRPEDYPVYEAQVKSDYVQLYADLCIKGGRPYDGILEMLGRLREAGYRTAVVSNKQQVLTRAVQLSTYPGLLDLAVGLQEGVTPKPDPTALLQVLEELGGTRETAVYVGDSEVDIATGKNAGIFTIAVTWGFRSRKLLLSHSPDMLVDTVEELERQIFLRG